MNVNVSIEIQIIQIIGNDYSLIFRLSIYSSIFSIQSNILERESGGRGWGRGETQRILGCHWEIGDYDDDYIYIHAEIG